MVVFLKNGKSFEGELKKLEAIVNKLENGSESLEDSLKLFEQGTKIANYCYEVLQTAEQKIIDLSKNKIYEEKNNE